MTPPKILLPLFLPMLCLASAACSGKPPPAPAIVVSAPLLPVPADLRACILKAGVSRADLPDRAWTVAEVERIAKRLKVDFDDKDGCGKRLLAFYDDQRARSAK